MQRIRDQYISANLNNEQSNGYYTKQVHTRVHTIPKMKIQMFPVDCPANEETDDRALSGRMGAQTSELPNTLRRAQ